MSSDDNTSSTSTPSDAMMELLAPDGYYKYLGITKRSSSSTEEAQHLLSHQNNTPTIDLDQVKKNYRKLSLKHHPDKRGGDVETFRVLNRAQHVLSSPKLRQQYDILGIDLDDEEHHADAAADTGESGSGGDGGSKDLSIVQEIANMALTSLIQLLVRTGTLSLSFFSKVVSKNDGLVLRVHQQSNPVT